MTVRQGLSHSSKPILLLRLPNRILLGKCLKQNQRQKNTLRTNTGTLLSVAVFYLSEVAAAAYFLFGQMQALNPIQPRFTKLFNRQLLKPLNLRAFSSSPDDYTNQSRGGLPRFFSEELPASKGGVVRVQGDEFRHMTKVLRLSTNARVELFNGKGSLVEGCIERIDRTGLDFVALEDPTLVPPLSTQWHVFAAFGTLKGDRADWLVEKCTELGAHSVTPLLTERSPSISENRVDRLRRVILAATKQSQRLHEMILNPPAKIVGLLPLLAQSKLSFLAAAGAPPVVSVLTSSRKESSGLMIVGPEGG
ncbi:RIBOSOMAL RNA SMALL SUBUNIT METHYLTRANSFERASE E [Salix purpurea]|uniref:16S rRNA (uracil(1498)-N(3))-methyltransferase n=1 Tax=Salix purpurea TaxID=77065 RepID=A0A9Q0VW95_SALPP|nr:RIBOSOMAL RNA SMALL SUBUNIT METHYLTRANSFERASE E [Salix purpurea]